jgi:hypothetical protein
MTVVSEEVDAGADVGEMLKGLESFAQIAKKHVGQKIAVLCARYQYRGVVAHVADDCIVLTNSRSVEISGPSAAPKPEREDDIGGFVVIKLDAIEIMYQPTWSQAPLADETV